MDIEELKQAVRDVINEDKTYARKPPLRKATSKRTPKKKPLEFKQKLLVFASVMYAATWLVAVVSWFIMGEVAAALCEYSTYLYGAALAVYGAVVGFENTAKIKAVNETDYSE